MFQGKMLNGLPSLSLLLCTGDPCMGEAPNSQGKGAPCHNICWGFQSLHLHGRGLTLSFSPPIFFWSPACKFQSSCTSTGFLS